jgi:hypothetical protein
MCQLAPVRWIPESSSISANGSFESAGDKISQTRVPCRHKSAKFTPPGSGDAPIGNARPREIVNFGVDRVARRLLEGPLPELDFFREFMWKLCPTLVRYL